MKAWNKYIEELNSGVYSDRLMDIYLDSFQFWTMNYATMRIRI